MANEISLHVDTVVDVSDVKPVGTDGNPIDLTDLVLTSDSEVVTVNADSDPTDDLVDLTTGSTVGATANLSATAKGSDGKDYVASATVTLMAKEMPLPGEFTLTFVERAA